MFFWHALRAINYCTKGKSTDGYMVHMEFFAFAATTLAMFVSML